MIYCTNNGRFVGTCVVEWSDNTANEQTLEGVGYTNPLFSLALTWDIVLTTLCASHASLSPWRRDDYLTSTTESPTCTVPAALMDPQTPT